MSADASGAARAAADVMAELTGPGGRFEIRLEDVLGVPMPVFAQRRRALHELLAASAEFGDRDAIVTAGRRISFADHAAQACALAAGLRAEYGIRPGDRVAIAAANSPEWVITLWATVSMGAIAVAFNAWWSPVELARATEHSTPRVVVADRKRAAALAGAAVPVLSIEERVPGLIAAYRGAPLPHPDVAEDDPATIIYTSGTSGVPKGAVHSHRSLIAVTDYHALGDAVAHEMGDPKTATDRRHLLVLPLFHIAALHNLAVPKIAQGSALVIHEGAFDADKVLRLIEAERVTNWGAVPTMANRILDLGDLSGYDLSSLTAFALASAPSSTELKDRLRAALPVAAVALVDSYGLTESATGIALATPEDLAEAPGTLGRPNVTVSLEIRDLDGNTLPDGQEGEICVRSAFNMLGYWNDEAATAAALSQDRWMRTGDLGVIENGRVRLATRRSDLILRGGENIYPAEVELALARHPGVAEVIVIGVDHPDLGQEVGAVVVTDPGSTVTEAELAAFARENLAYFKVPSRWRITAQPLPRNATGKVIRREVEIA